MNTTWLCVTNMKEPAILLATSRQPPQTHMPTLLYAASKGHLKRQCATARMVIGFPHLLRVDRHSKRVAGHRVFLESEDLCSTTADIFGIGLSPHAQFILNAKAICDAAASWADGGAFSVSAVREKKLSVEEFPGFNSVCVSFQKLQIIIEQQIQSWYGALSNIKGVYLIADTKAGKLYVGSATGDSGIWQRWSSYVTSGHGGNKELRALFKSKPTDYCSHFQYSILEIADSHASDDYILKRESYWKDVLMSRVHGYNSN